MVNMEQIKVINNEWIKTENEYWIHKRIIIKFYVSREGAVIAETDIEDIYESYKKYVLKVCKSEKEAHQLLEYTLRSL